MQQDHIGIPVGADDSITDPAALRSQNGINWIEERSEHDSSDHCGVGTDGRVVLDSQHDDGERRLSADSTSGMLPATGSRRDQECY